MYTPPKHRVVRGTGTPKNREEVKKREVSECDGWECDLEGIGSPSMFNVIHSVVSFCTLSLKTQYSMYLLSPRDTENFFPGLPDILVTGISEWLVTQKKGTWSTRNFFFGGIEPVGNKGMGEAMLESPTYKKT